MNFIDEIITEVLSNIDRKLKVETILTNTKVKFCNLKWSSLFRFLQVDGIDNAIVSIDFENEIIEFKNNISSVTNFVIPDTVFFIGSRMITSSEFLLYSNDYREKVPFVWLNFPAGVTSSIDSSGLSPILEQWQNVRLFFVGDMDRSQWLSKQTIDFRTKILYDWAKAYTDAFNHTNGVEISDESSFNYFPIFGKENENGAIEDIIEGNLSAVSVTIDINLLSKKCKC